MLDGAVSSAIFAVEFVQVSLAALARGKGPHQIDIQSGSLLTTQILSLR